MGSLEGRMLSQNPLPLRREGRTGTWQRYLHPFSFDVFMTFCTTELRHERGLKQRRRLGCHAAGLFVLRHLTSHLTSSARHPAEPPVTVAVATAVAATCASSSQLPRSSTATRKHMNVHFFKQHAFLPSARQCAHAPAHKLYGHLLQFFSARHDNDFAARPSCGSSSAPSLVCDGAATVRKRLVRKRLMQDVVRARPHSLQTAQGWASDARLWPGEKRQADEQPLRGNAPVAAQRTSGAGH